MSITRKIKRSHQDHAGKYERREGFARNQFIRASRGSSQFDFGTMCVKGNNYAGICHKERYITRASR